MRVLFKKWTEFMARRHRIQITEKNIWIVLVDDIKREQPGRFKNKIRQTK